MLTHTEELVFQHLSRFVSDHRKETIERVLNQRTRYLTIILEDIFQSQNASAVVRTCECMGLQEIHMVENITKYSINPKVLRGANKWIDIKRYRSKKEHNTIACFDRLRRDGYKILVADPDEDGISIHDVDVKDSMIALLFGNELRGASKEAIANCDAKVKIPMYGFTESLNISVSVAICLDSLVNKLHNENVSSGLSSTEKDLIRLNWYRKIVRKSDLIEREFLRTIQ
jgi:tRNA (guanosine-2'-O-)-methyltransferase